MQPATGKSGHPSKPVLELPCTARVRRATTAHARKHVAQSNRARRAVASFTLTNVKQEPLEHAQLAPQALPALLVNIKPVAMVR